MSSHPFGVGLAPRTDPLRVLEVIQRLAVEQLGSVPGALFGPVEHTLQQASERGEEMPFLDQVALRTMRQRYATHVMNYRQQIARGFDDFRARRARNHPMAPLELIDEDQLELHIAGQRVAESIEQRFAWPLGLMDGRLRALALELGLPAAVNPIGPARLTAAFMETFSDEQIPLPLRTLMLNQYSLELAKVLEDLYSKINALLSSSGYALGEVAQPAMPPVRPPAALADAPRATEFDRSAVHDGDAVESLGGGLRSSRSDNAQSHDFAQLRGQLRAWRESAASARPAEAPARGVARPPAPRRELQVAEVVSVASLLQSEPTEPFARALASAGRLADVIRDQLSDGSRRLGLNPDQLRFSANEEDAIDLVALLFDSLFESHSLQDRARRLYSRLVLPYVKVAMTDESMFVQATHPARRLLDAITEACDGNSAETPQERELLARAAAASQRIVAEYNEDMSIFEVAHAELDALLQQQRRRIEMQEERAAKATSGRERLSHARERADQILADRLIASPLSPAIADFLVTPWRHHLAQTLLREGEGAESHVEALALGEALVLADQLAAEGRGASLADHILAHEPAIIACLASSGLDGGAAEHGMAVLVRGLIYPNIPRQLHPVPATQVNVEDAEERGLWLAGGTDTVAHDPALADRMRQLQPGEWLQLVDAQGETSSAKVAWVSPLTARRLLVNRRGVRVLVASAEELAALAGSGRLKLGGEPAAFDEAMRHVREHLDRAVGQQ